jgi:hypothetical protein
VNDEDAADTAATAVHRSILDAMADRPEMVTKWTAVVEFIDEHGRKGAYRIHAPEATSWDIAGMLTWSLQVQQALTVLEQQE